MTPCIWFTEQTLSSRENRLQATLPDNWHPTTGLYDTGTLCRPTGHIFLHRIIHDNLILYTHINCKDDRDLDILVFCFLFLESFLGVFWVLVSFLCSWFWFFGLVFFRFLGFLSFFGVLLWDFWFWFWFFVFCFCLVLVFCDFVILLVVAYCTQLLSQAMYNLMMAAMAETCSC